jgi:hypothetical protein
LIFAPGDVKDFENATLIVLLGQRNRTAGATVPDSKLMEIDVDVAVELAAQDTAGEAITTIINKAASRRIGEIKGELMCRLRQ